MLPILGAIAVGAGAIFGAASKREEGKEARRVAEHNARIAEMAARDAIMRASQQAGRHRMAASQVISQQQAIIGASGVDPGAGTAVRLAEASRGASTFDELVIKNNAARQAYGIKLQADEMRRQGRAAQKAANAAAVGVLLGGAGQVAGMGYNFGWWG